MEKEEVDFLRAEAGKSYIDNLTRLLSEAEFCPTAYCLEHGRHCPISPRYDARFKRMLWIEAAGT
eukprot:2104517-Alexandrium_andersonii.AAC.1